VAKKLPEVQIRSLDGVVAGSGANYSVELRKIANIPLDLCSSLLSMDIRIISSIPEKIPSYKAVAWGCNTC
jgi:hypothetical protein